MAQSSAPSTLSGADRVRERYTKYEFLVPMRDGVRLFTSIYAPKDTSQKGVVARIEVSAAGAVTW